MKKRKEQISLGVRVIIIRGDKVLIIRQRKPNGRDVYILAGGGIEASEDIFTLLDEKFLKNVLLMSRSKNYFILKNCLPLIYEALNFMF
jgi:ADP-ribose pyrophosphatase YjhB (NUDIX family)